MEKQTNSSVSKDHPTEAPDSTAKEKGGSRRTENSTAPSSVSEENTQGLGEEDVQVMASREPEVEENVTAVIEPPENTEESSKSSRGDHNHLPPFSIHTGQESASVAVLHIHAASFLAEGLCVQLFMIKRKGVINNMFYSQLYQHYSVSKFCTIIGILKYILHFFIGILN